MQRRTAMGWATTLGLGGLLIAVVASCADPRTDPLEAEVARLGKERGDLAAEVASLSQSVEAVGTQLSRPSPTPRPTATANPQLTTVPTPTATPTPTLVPASTLTPLATPTPKADDLLRSLIRPHWRTVTELVDAAPGLIELAVTSGLAWAIREEFPRASKPADDAYWAAYLIWDDGWEQLPRLRHLRDVIEKAFDLSVELVQLSINLREPCEAGRCLRARFPSTAWARLQDLQDTHQDLRVFLGEP